MFSGFNSTSRATWGSRTPISSKQSRNEDPSQSAQLPSTSIQIQNPAIGQNWHLPSNWNWRGNSKEPKDTIFKYDRDFPGTEWSPSSTKSTELGHSNATVTRVICQGKVLARKTEKIDKRIGTAHLEEMRILQRLNHQHIIQLCGSYSVGDVFNCLMYPVAEMDLRAYMHMGKWNETANWTRTLSSGLGCLSNALAYIHANGIKHKDIKPENILVLGDVMILADFGSARSVQDRTGPSGSKSNDLNGMTPMYMPPEVMDGQGHGRSADVFSLGLVFGEMVDYIFAPRNLSAVERRLQISKEDLRKPSRYIPRWMTEDDEEFLDYMPMKRNEMIAQEEMRMLFKVMTLREPQKRPSAREVWGFLRGRFFDVVLGDTMGEVGVPETCGKCCL